MNDRDRTFGYTDVDEKAQLIEWGGSLFVHSTTTERNTDNGRRVLRTFVQVTFDIEVKTSLDEDF
jgi:hypothetical protein